METLACIIKVEADSPLEKDKGKGFAIPGSSAPADEAGDGGAMALAHQFVHHQARRSTPTPTARQEILVEVGPSLEGLNPCFRPNVLVMTHTKGRNRDFSWIRVNP